jgi:flagellin
MALVVNTNVPSIASQRYLMESRKEMETAMERLSSGKRINSAADDAAGLAITERMNTQITGLNMAIRNANDGISLTQTAEGAMQEVTDILQRMRELSLQAVHGVNSDSDRASLDAEVQALKAEIDRIAGSTTFNNISILDGSYSANFQIGYNAGETIDVALGSVDTSSLGLNVGSAAAVESGTNTLISNRLVETFKFDADLDGQYWTAGTANGAIYSLGTTAGSVNAAGKSFAAGDILINGQELDAFDGTLLASAGGDDIWDLVDNINTNVDNVLASAFNVVVAKTVGDGVVAEDELAIKVGAIGKNTDSHYQAATYVMLGASSSMQELVDNINRAFTNDEVVASINSDGKLVLSNDTGASIHIADKTGTNGAYDGATGFEVEATAVSATAATGYVGFQGFLKLQSTDGSAIEVEKGNLGLSSPGTISDLKSIGFTEIKEDPTGSSYSVVGSALTAASIHQSSGDLLDKDSTTGQADLSINGVEIYDDTLSASSYTFQGKLDLINAFTDETNVVASAYYERVFDTSNVTFVTNNTMSINGTSVDYGASASALVTNINAVKHTTGVTAELDGKNVILRGDGVQAVHIVNNDYTVASDNSANELSNLMKTKLTSRTHRTATFNTADVKTGRTLTLTLSADTGNTRLTAQSKTFSYTVTSSDSISTIAEKFYNLIVENMLEKTGSFTGGSVANFITHNNSGSIFFKSLFSAGSAKISIGVTQLGAGNRLFSAKSADQFGALKLQSSNGQPISINFGEGATASGELGLVEMNVGDTTYDVNSPTSSVSQMTVASVNGVSVATSAAAESAIEALDAALATISESRGKLGAIQNRLNHTVSNLANVVENTAASQSRILDADFAVEAAALARAQILQQAGTAMLAQANQLPQTVLALLQ